MKPAEKDCRVLTVLERPKVICDLENSIVFVGDRSRPLSIKTTEALMGRNVHHLPLKQAPSERPRLIYWACKDILPPRTTSRRAAAGPLRSDWRADLTIYHPDTLPSSELNRSVGHRNGSRCVEIFEVWLGAVRMMLQPPYRRGGAECFF